MNNEITNEDIKKLYIEGNSLKTIEAQTGVSATQVKRILLRQGVVLRPNKTPVEIEKQIIKDYLSDISSEKIAAKYNKDVGVVCAVLKRNNIELKGAKYFNSFVKQSLEPKIEHQQKQSLEPKIEHQQIVTRRIITTKPHLNLSNKDGEMYLQGTSELKFDDVIVLNGHELTRKYIESLSFEEREELVEPIFSLLRKNGLSYPDNLSKIVRSYENLCKCEADIENDTVYNNSSIATDVCKHFCRSFYKSTTKNGRTMEEVFNEDGLLKRLIRNRLGMDWYHDDAKGPGVNEAFNLAPKMFIQGMRSMMLVPQTSIFKPDIAKYMCMKYSEPGDLVGDYSCGFGGRMLGAACCGRKYIGTDPLTVPELRNMAEYLKLQDITLIESGSENYRGEENSVDFYWSSPPYFDQEVYSNDISQAYNQGEDYFYNVYWKKTLDNVRYMLKPGKWFGLNVHNYPKMLSMAEEIFGNYVETVKLHTHKSHLNKVKTENKSKVEMIYMFKNNK
jgi:hypothetical protein